MGLNLINFKKNNIKLKLNKNLFNFNIQKTQFKKKTIFLPFFSLIKMSNTQNRNIFFSYNKSLLNSIFTKLKQNYLAFYNGFYLELLAVGVGYRFERLNKNNNILVINVGYSHYIYYLVDKLISFRCTKGYLFLFSIDLPKLKTTAVQIKKYKTPNVYTGKGIKYLKQEIILKVGKKKK